MVVLLQQAVVILQLLALLLQLDLVLHKLAALLLHGIQLLLDILHRRNLSTMGTLIGGATSSYFSNADWIDW